MIWFKVNDRWCFDVTQIRDFGIPKDRTGTIMVTYKDGTEEYYGTDNPAETFARLIEFVNTLYLPITAYNTTEEVREIGMV